MSEAKQTAHAWVDEHRDVLSAWNRAIWEFAEPAWREYRSAAWYIERLRAEGFDVEAGSGGMPTAFSATWSHGDGPTVLSYAEYDAVPGNSQAAATHEGPRPGTSRFAAGHTDPHSALGIGSLAGLFATKAAMARHGIGGTLRYMGEPAEKMQGSKVVHGLRGYYDGVDAILSFHPFYMLPLCNTVRWDTQCGAYYSRVYSFIAREAGEWSSSSADGPIPAAHTSARAPGANAALATMLSVTKTTQESMLAHLGGWSMNEAILSAGNCTADNLPAPLAQIQYAWRVPDVAMAESVLTVLEANARHAAAVAHCDVLGSWVARNRPGVANHALAAVVWANLRAVGPPRYGQDALAVAREIQTELGLKPMEEPFLPACEELLEPREAERRLRRLLPSWQRSWTSDDYVEMSWYAPTARFYVARPVLRAPESGAYPTWVMNALGGIPVSIDPTVVCAAKTLAGSQLDLLMRPATLAEARLEFEARLEGEPHREPLLPRDHVPPLNLPWPEYVTTARGAEWVNPFDAEPLMVSSGSTDSMELHSPGIT